MVTVRTKILSKIAENYYQLISLILGYNSKIDSNKRSHELAKTNTTLTRFSQSKIYLDGTAYELTETVLSNSKNKIRLLTISQYWQHMHFKGIHGTI